MAGISFRTGGRADWVAPRSSGRFAGLEIADRQDQRSTAARGRGRHGERSQSTTEALEWAARCFEPRLVQFAAVEAMILRDLRGVGNVTKDAVMTRLRQRRPYLFDDPKGAHRE